MSINLSDLFVQTIPCHLCGCYYVTKPELTLADAAKVAAKRAKPRLNYCIPAGKLVAFVVLRQLGGCERAEPFRAKIMRNICTRSLHSFNQNEKLQHVLKDSNDCQ